MDNLPTLERSLSLLFLRAYVYHKDKPLLQFSYPVQRFVRLLFGATRYTDYLEPQKILSNPANVATVSAFLAEVLVTHSSSSELFAPPPLYGFSYDKLYCLQIAFQSHYFDYYG